MTAADGPAWLAMRAALWPKANPDELAGEIAGLIARDDFAVFGALGPSGEWLGFAEVGTRDVAKGCATSPVGYLEGVWVDRTARRQGVGRRLVEVAMDWARKRGYREFASDAELANVDSQGFHRRIGFDETGPVVCFRRALTG